MLAGHNSDPQIWCGASLGSHLAFGESFFASLALITYLLINFSLLYNMERNFALLAVYPPPKKK